MRRLVFFAAARNDLVSILDFIARESRDVDRGRWFVKQIRNQCAKLATLPGTLGRDRSELRPGIRSVAFKGYIIFFRYGDEALEIVNVLEGHRDIDAHLGPR